MPDLNEFIKKLKPGTPGGNVAGYVVDKKFHYEVSNSEHLPAAALLFDGSPTRMKTNVYTSLTEDHWLYTYMGMTERASGMVHLNGVGKSGVEVTEAVAAGRRSLKVLAGETSAGPLGSGGGLYKAAKDLETNPKFYKTKDKGDLSFKGMHRALRYYMLAAYAALGQCAKVGYEGGNYVCSMAVSDNGQIISWGVNSGSFHHGEVNMLLNYFSAHTTATSLPAKTIVFSTLTPCKQCATYIEKTRPTDSVVFMGQQDTGDFGKEGEAYGKYLRELTDPVRARVEVGETLTTTTKVENKPTPTKFDRAKTTQVKTLESTKVAELTRYGVDDKLKELITDGSIAGKIGKTCKAELIHSYNTLNHKFTKVRPPAEELSDQLIKVAVLTYLQKWLATVGTETKIKAV